MSATSPGETRAAGAAAYSFDVATASHDEVKAGLLARRWSRVTVSGTEWPDWRVAQEVAAALAVAVHGGMATAVLPID